MFKFKNSTIINGDVKDPDLFKNCFIDLIITSPPYNVGIEYSSNSDSLTYGNYLDFSHTWLKNCFNWSNSQARLLLNIPLDKNKFGHQSVGADMTAIAKEAGWKYHSTIIWNESNISKRTAWGSFKSASAPYVIAPVELIVVLYKESWKKTRGSKINDITKEEFIAWTNGVWNFNGENPKKIGHPAPFPRELPRRCIKLFSYVDDMVFDPFVGSGTTLIEAQLNNRRSIGVDIDKSYCELSLRRLHNNCRKQINLL
jgi:site-specific DNA-methyltransferase (adenine-specific)